MPRPALTAETVYARLAALRMRRMDDYPGHVQDLFTVGCLDCPREWQTKYALLYAADRKRGCRPCSYLERNADLAVPADVAEAELRAAGREPLEPFPGMKKKWRSRCLQCDTVASPVLNNIRFRGTASCDECAKPIRGSKRRLAESEALRVMRAGGVQPIGPYPGSSVPWQSVCLAEGHEVSPTYDNVKAGNGGCSVCAPFGISLSDPAIVYVLHHAEYDAHKVGIAKAAPVGKVSRISHLRRRYGWQEFGRVEVDTGAAALQVEAHVLSQFPGRTRYLSREQTEGWTETMSADAISLPDLLRLVQTAAHARR